MCNCTPEFALRAPRNDRLFLVNRLRVEQSLRIHERQPHRALACLDLSVKTGAPAGVAGSTGRLDPDPDRVLIAIDADLDDPLDVT